MKLVCDGADISSMAWSNFSLFFFSSRRRHTRSKRDWSSDVCSSDLYDARLNLCKQVAEEAKEYFGGRMFTVTIPRNVRLAEAPSFGKPILLYDVQSIGAKSYLAVAQELIRRVEQDAPPSPSLPAIEPQPEVSA